jgi:hypothetical protein
MIGMFRTSTFRASGLRGSGLRASGDWRRRWLAVMLLALLADLSASVATHRHAPHASGSAVVEQSSRTPAPAPLQDASLEDVCAICGALAGSVAACTTRIPIELDAALGRVLAALRAPALFLASEWWAATASRAPPSILSRIH